MHVILVKRGNLYLERSKPRYTLDKKDTSGTMLEGVGTVYGEVSAVSADKLYLQLPDGKIQEILRGDADMPQAGQRISVTYTGGRPPKALSIRKLKD